MGVLANIMNRSLLGYEGRPEVETVAMCVWGGMEPTSTQLSKGIVERMDDGGDLFEYVHEIEHRLIQGGREEGHR